MKLCPFCAEEIQDAAIVCKHCGKDVQPTKTIITPIGTDKPPVKPPSTAAKLILPLLLLLLIGGCWKMCSGGGDDKKAIKSNPTAINTVVDKIKKDTLYEVKEVQFDSSLNTFKIAFSNKHNIIKDKDYSAVYFNNTYHLMDIDGVKGIYLYANKIVGKPIQWKSQYYDEFVKSQYQVDIKSFLEKTVNDPTGLEIVNSKVLSDNADGWFTVQAFFRAKNAFGALMPHSVTCDLTLEGKAENIVYDK